MESLSKEKKDLILLGGCELFIHQYLLRYRKHTHDKPMQGKKEHCRHTMLKLQNSAIFSNSSDLPSSLKKVTMVFLREMAIFQYIIFGGRGACGADGEIFI